MEKDNVGEGRKQVLQVFKETLASDLLFFEKRKVRRWRVLFVIAAVGWIATLICFLVRIG